MTPAETVTEFVRAIEYFDMGTYQRQFAELTAGE